MSRIYLINVGANTAHRSTARSPLFPNGSFEYVPYWNKKEGVDGYYKYPKAARLFIRTMQNREPHCDPDWDGLTYGDNCGNPRAAALKQVEEDDTLLFWALLWRNTGSTWNDFTNEKSWALIGALRVREILRPGQRPQDAKATRVARARRNVHFAEGRLAPENYVFIGCTKHSRLFSTPVDLEATNRRDLLYKCIRSATGARLSIDKEPKWYTSLRGVRAVWDLDVDEERTQAKIARDAIRNQTGYDLLKDL